MKIRHFDAVIAGASVAGCTAALACAARGLRTLLVERRTALGGYKEFCTHFVQPAAWPVMERLGLRAELEALGGVRTKAAFCTGGRWIDPPGDYARAPGAEPPLWALNIERRILDPHLLARVRMEREVELRLGDELASAEREPAGRWRLRTRGGGAGEEIGAALLVAADGRGTALAHRFGNEAAAGAPNDRACVFGRFRGVEAPRGDRSVFLRRGDEMAFLYPLGPGRAVLAAYMPKEDYRRDWKDAEPAARLLRAFEGYPGLPPLRGAVLESRIYKYLDYPNLVRRPAAAGAAFIGDAAASLDPMSGVGCAFAMISGEMLAEALAGNPGDPAGALEAYARAFDGFFPPHLKGICADSLASGGADKTDAVYDLLERDPGLQQDFLRLTGRLVTPLEFQKAFFRSSTRRLKPAGAAAETAPAAGLA